LRFGDSELVFGVEPVSLAGLALLCVVLLALGYFGVSYVRAAGWGRGLLLSGLRALVLTTLALLILQPGLVSLERVLWTLPESFTKKVVHPVDPERLLGLVPPLAYSQPPQWDASGDIYLESVIVPPMAFIKSSTKVLVDVVNDGATVDAQVLVSPVEDGEAVASDVQRVVLQPGRQQLAVSVTPTRLGVSAWRVAVEPQGGDLVPENNMRVFSLTTTRDSLRVLHVAGRPSWDVRFMRQFLTSLPGADLVSFFLMVEAEDFAPHGRDELSLIPFPIDDIFLDELGNFDLVVLQNFPLGTYFLVKEKHARQLAEFVRSGGALLVVGGDQAFRAGLLEATAVAEVLPVDLEASDALGDYLAGSFEVIWSGAGRWHPATVSLFNEGETPDGAELPALAALNPLGSVREGAEVLAKVKVAVAGADAVEYPLVVVGGAGEGRVGLVATDSLWRWAFPPKPDSQSMLVYRGFMSGIVDWLSWAPGSQEFEVAATTSPALVGAETAVQVCGRGVTSNRLKGKKVLVKAKWIDALGSQSPMALERAGEFLGSCAVVVLPPVGAGAWSVEARLESGEGSGGGQGSRAIVAVEPRHKSFAQRLAEAFRPVLERPMVPLLINWSAEFNLPGATLEMDKPRLDQLWRHPALFAMLALLVALEWGLRRKWGYL